MKMHEAGKLEKDEFFCWAVVRTTFCKVPATMAGHTHYVDDGCIQ